MRELVIQRIYNVSMFLGRVLFYNGDRKDFRTWMEQQSDELLLSLLEWCLDQPSLPY